MVYRHFGYVNFPIKNRSNKEKEPSLSANCCFSELAGADPEGDAPGARPPKIGKNKIFWRKIVIFHTKYPNNFRASLRSAQFF